MPNTTLDKLEQIVGRRLPSNSAAKQPSGRPGPRPLGLEGITRTAAWGIVLLLLTVPLIAAVLRRPNLVWIPWAIISVRAALDSRHIAAALSSPTRNLRAARGLVLALAALNLLTAIYALFG